MDVLRRTNPLIVLNASVTLFLSVSTDPWWSMSGASNDKLLEVQFSPFYFHASGIDLSARSLSLKFLGPSTRIPLILYFLPLGMASLSPSAWWRELAVYSSVSILLELYFSFLLNYHAAETLLLGSYGAVPAYSGTSALPAVVVGLDLRTYASPLLAAGFGLPFYLGFLSLGLIGGSNFLKWRQERLGSPRPGGVEAIFTPSPAEEPSLKVGSLLTRSECVITKLHQ